MASLEKRGEHYRIVFRYAGRKYHAAVKAASTREAEALRGRLEENLILLERGKLDPPADGELGLFLLTDGKINAKPKVAVSLALSQVFREYKEKFTAAAKESSTRATEVIHMRHLERLIGSRTGIRSITAETLQSYADERVKEKSRTGEFISQATVRKELGTLASIWNKWALPQGLVAGSAPTKGIVFRKGKTKPPFQTWQQVERKIARGGLTPAEIEGEWDSLFLSVDEVQAFLGDVKKTARFAFIYPAIVFAAHTGARRSEIIRSEIDDFDFDAGVVRIREKKRDRSKESTFRHVPLSTDLRSTMKAWFDVHPGGQLTICSEANVPLSPQMAAHHFVWAVEGTKWAKLRGWHTLRHSFISNCAARGVDQRTIDAWSGHQTPEMAARYRHIFPADAEKSMTLVFG